MMDNGGMFFGGGFMWIFWLVAIVVLVVAVKALTNGGSQTDEMKQYSALDILKKRYASGEIDEEEFKRRRKELQG